MSVLVRRWCVIKGVREYAGVVREAVWQRPGKEVLPCGSFSKMLIMLSASLRVTTAAILGVAAPAVLPVVPLCVCASAGGWH